MDAFAWIDGEFPPRDAATAASSVEQAPDPPRTLAVLRDVGVDSCACQTLHPSGPTLARWLREAGFREVLPRAFGGDVAEEVFDRTPVASPRVPPRPASGRRAAGRRGGRRGHPDRIPGASDRGRPGGRAAGPPGPPRSRREDAMDRRHLLVGLLLSLAAGACGKPAPPVEPPPVPVVTVSTPVTRDVLPYVDFTGRTDAVESVEIRARVTGYLQTVSFKEGGVVKVGDPLFVIDPRPFQARCDEEVAQLALRQANLRQREADLDRARGLLPKGAVSQADFDKAVAARDEAVASIQAAEASVASARLNLEFTAIASPIVGRIGRTEISVGNLVRADETLLTTIVAQDPIHVYFDVDEPTRLRIARRMVASAEDPLETRKVPVLIGLADEEGFPHEGVVDFADNAVDPSTGTLTVRGAFANPAGPSGRRLLQAGMFVRVRLPLGQPRPAVLVAERALGTDQGRKYVLVVDDQEVVQYRPVEVGPLEDDGLRVILDGLRGDERVVVSGLQQVRPRMAVEVEEAPAAGAAPDPPADAPSPPPPAGR